jgi:hypothetical protein
MTMTGRTENGNQRERLFCGDCGSPMLTMLAEQPEIAIVKAGTLDDRSGFAPTAEIWCQSAHEWVDARQTRVRFEGDLAPG